MSVPSLVVFDSKAVVSRSCLALARYDEEGKNFTGFEKRGRPKKQRDDSALFQHSRFGKPGRTSNFVFVAYNGKPEITLQSQKIVRRRAMLDFRKKERIQKQTTGHTTCSLREQVSDNPTPVAWASAVQKLFLNEIVEADPFDAFALKIQPYVLDLLKSYSTTIFEAQYTIEKYTKFNPVKECWLPMAFAEPAFLHAVIFCADIVNSVSRKVQERKTAVFHLNQAIILLNEQLQCPSFHVTDHFLVVVCALASVEKMNGSHSNWKTHMLGLRGMVRQRGGMHTLRRSPLIQNKIHRADLCGSIDSLQPPYFEAPLYSPEISRAMFSVPSLSASRFPHLDENLRWILPRIQEVTCCLTLIHLQQTDIHPTTLRESITSLKYTLISCDTTNETSSQRITRVSLLMYCITILNDLPRGASSFHMLGQKLRSDVENIGSDHEFNTEFMMWTMFLAASIINQDETRAYFLSGAVTAMYILKLSSWEEIERVLRSFFWVEEIHASSFRRTWEDMCIVQQSTI